MGYYSLFCLCITCKRHMLCNPDLVPSIRVNGIKEPVCESCVKRWNTIHNGNFVIPEGAYKPAKEYGEAALEIDDLSIGRNE